MQLDIRQNLTCLSYFPHLKLVFAHVLWFSCRQET